MINQIILGIDPGYDRLGWAVLSGTVTNPITVDFGCLKSKKDLTIDQKYVLVQLELEKIISNYQPNHLAIETLFFSVNKKTALQVSEVRGVIISTCARNKLKVTQHHPNSIKLAVTGAGHADKKAVEKMIRLQLKIPPQKIIDDAIDALAVALTHLVTKI